MKSHGPIIQVLSTLISLIPYVLKNSRQRSSGIQKTALNRNGGSETNSTTYLFDVLIIDVLMMVGKKYLPKKSTKERMKGCYGLLTIIVDKM